MVSRVSKLLLAGVAATALAGASMTGAALARGGHGGPGGGGGPGPGMGGGSVGPGPSGGSFAAHSGPGPGAGSSFGGRETVGVAPNAHSNMMGPGVQNGGRTFNHSFQGRTFNGNDRWSGDQWHRGHDRDHRHFRGGFFGFGFGPSYDDYYYDDYAYNDCSYYNRWDWRWRRYCGPYAYRYGPYAYDYGW